MYSAVYGYHKSTAFILRSLLLSQGGPLAAEVVSDALGTWDTCKRGWNSYWSMGKVVYINSSMTGSIMHHRSNVQCTCGVSVTGETHMQLVSVQHSESCFRLWDRDYYTLWCRKTYWFWQYSTCKTHHYSLGLTPSGISSINILMKWNVLIILESSLMFSQLTNYPFGFSIRIHTNENDTPKESSKVLL